MSRFAGLNGLLKSFVDRGLAGGNGFLGESGWCGLAGTWVLIDPKE